MKERTSRPAAAKGGARKTSASRSPSSRSGRSGSRSRSGSTLGGAAAAPAAPGARGARGAQPAAPGQGDAAFAGMRNIPAESQAAREQAERDANGEARPGYVRRAVPAGGANYGNNFYAAGDDVEIPQGLADHLDAQTVNPDASIEANRESKFSGGEEDDHEAQGESIKSSAEDSRDAAAEHRKSDAFDALPRGGGKKSGGKK